MLRQDVANRREKKRGGKAKYKMGRGSYTLADTCSASLAFFTFSLPFYLVYLNNYGKNGHVQRKEPKKEEGNVGENKSTRGTGRCSLFSRKSRNSESLLEPSSEAPTV